MDILSFLATAIGGIVIFILWVIMCLAIGGFLYEYHSVGKELKPHPQWKEGMTFKQRIKIKMMLVATCAKEITFETKDGTVISIVVSRMYW